MYIKLCANTNLQDAQLCAASGAQALGFVLLESPRRISVATAGAINAHLPGEIEKIAVIANEPVGRMMQIVKEGGFTGLQLHGDESPAAVSELKRLAPNVKIFKGLAFVELDQAKKYVGLADALLIDSGSPSQRGGTGRVFDWQAAIPLLEPVRGQISIVIAGGLNPENVAEAIKALKPDGVDVASGIEATKGRKDPEKIRAFVAAAQGASAS